MMHEWCERVGQVFLFDDDWAAAYQLQYKTDLEPASELLLLVVADLLVKLAHELVDIERIGHFRAWRHDFVARRRFGASIGNLMDLYQRK